MTPERKKYLDGISVEERLIRKAIKFQKVILWSRKKDLSTIATYPDEFCCPPRITKFAIAETKAVIKALKKQLPQKLVYVSANEDNIHWCLNCPACRYTIVPSNFTMSFFRNYCPCCGQKLR